ncbi:alpha/beta hydrolase [Gandjariella thermophila]|uniref:alpha/beta hydrolase n=1 Tax=Gandjariella thermophila TaxID=1931992 RepID=UPI001CEF9A77
MERGYALAEAWGGSIEVVPGGGHLASDDGFGQWDHIATVIERIAGRILEIRT